MFWNECRQAVFSKTIQPSIKQPVWQHQAAWFLGPQSLSESQGEIQAWMMWTQLSQVWTIIYFFLKPWSLETTFQKERPIYH